MIMYDVTTTDLADFGMREIEMLRDTLDAWVKHGLPEDFEGNEVRAMMNKNSGNVFLTNSEYQVAMDCDGQLESFYSCPECGHEGFFHEMDNEGQECCSAYVRECRGF